MFERQAFLVFFQPTASNFSPFYCLFLFLLPNFFFLKSITLIEMLQE